MALRSRAIWEAAFPYFWGALAAGSVSLLSVNTPLKIEAAGISVPILFTALQNFQLFGAGVLFSVFVFTMAPAAGFVKKLQNLNIFRVFRRYTLEALILGVAGWMVCMPLSAAKPETLIGYPYPLVTVISILFGVSFAFALFRVVRIFFFWTRQM